MAFLSRGSAGRARTPRKPAFFRPALEALEERRAPASGIFIEDFSLDTAPTQPGWDSWDADPNTLPPDELFIGNNRPDPGATNGPTRIGGYYAIVPDGAAPYGPHVLSMFPMAGSGAGFVFYPRPPFPTPNGSPGGPAGDEEIATVGLDVRGYGEVAFIGAGGEVAVTIAGSEWEHVAATRNSLDSHGTEIGEIQQVIVRTAGEPGMSFEVNRISVLVLPKEAPPPTTVIANDDAAVVSQRQHDPQVQFNWRQNDLQVNGEPLMLVGHTQPQHGTVIMNDATGTATYRPEAGYLGRDSFSYTIRDAQGNADTADVILDVTDNLAPVAHRYVGESILQYPRDSHGPFRWQVGYDDDGDALSATVTQEPHHGRIEFHTLPPDANGRSVLEVEYWPDHLHYGPYDGKLKFNDRFVFEVHDATTTAQSPGIVELLCTGYLGVYTVTLAPWAYGDEFIFNVDQPVDPALPGRLIVDAPGVLGNDDPSGLNLRESAAHFLFPLRPVYAELVTGPQHGLFHLNEDGSFEYLPDPDWVNGPGADKVDSFVYRIHDGLLIGNEVVAVIRVTTDALNESIDSRRHWFTLAARTDFVTVTPRTGDYITLSSLIQNDIWPGFGLESALISSNPVSNGLHLLFHADSANLKIEFDQAWESSVGGALRQPLGLDAAVESSSSILPYLTFSGVTFGRYRLAFKDGDEVRYSNYANFYVAVDNVDTDRDGVFDSVEAAAPTESGAAGLANVAALPNAVDGQYVHLTATPADGITSLPGQPRLLNVVPRAALGDEPLPPGVDFPVGFFEFGVRATAAIVRIDPPPGVRIDTYWKYGPEPDDANTVDDDWKKVPHWYQFTWDPATQTGAVIAANHDYIEVYLRDGQRGDDDLSINGVIWDPGAPGYFVPPHIETTVINDGDAQRSMINSVTVAFSDLVTLEAGAFELRKKNGRPIHLRTSINTVDGKTVAVLTFAGKRIVAGSLSNGRYTLTIHADRVHGNSGKPLDGDGDGTAGDDAVTAFFRRYGDTDGDRDVDSYDHKVFKKGRRSEVGDANYRWYLDHDRDGDIDKQDRARFKAELTSRLPRQCGPQQSGPQQSGPQLRRFAAKLYRKSECTEPQTTT